MSPIVIYSVLTLWLLPALIFLIWEVFPSSQKHLPFRWSLVLSIGWPIVVVWIFWVRWRTRPVKPVQRSS